MNMAVRARFGGLIRGVADVVLVAKVLFDVRKNGIDLVKVIHLVEAASGLQGDLLQYFLAVRQLLAAASRHRHRYPHAPAPHTRHAIAALVAIGGGIGKEYGVDQRIDRKSTRL